MLTFDGKGVVLHREDLREATRKAAERRRRQREQLSPFNRLKPGEKKHSKRMATVAAVYTVAPFVRSVEEFLQSLMPRQPLSKTKKGKKARTPAVRPRPVAKRVWASLEREPAEVIAEAMLEAERHDPERVKHWVVLVDGAETQLDLVEAGAAEFGVEVTVILDIIHVVEYVWKAAHVFHREGSPELSHWAWTRVRSILEGKSTRVAASMRRAATVAGLSSDTRKPVDTCADYLLKYAPYLLYDRYLAAGYPIATGVIEGACRHLVRDRMELTGARWRLVGAEAVLKLRALRASGDFDAYWDFHEAREYERNHAHRYADGIVPPVNTSLAVKEVLAGRDRVETEGFEAFRGGYPFRAEFCAPAKGWEKGSVEGGVKCRGAKVLDAFHVLPLLERKHRAVAEATALLDWRLAPVWRQVRAELARHTRKPDQEWVRMLRLMETHPAAAVERAVTAALERHSPRLETVRLILRQQQAGPPPVCPPVTSVRPELARIEVPAPMLSAYDALVEGS